MSNVVFPGEEKFGRRLFLEDVLWRPFCFDCFCRLMWYVGLLVAGDPLGSGEQSSDCTGWRHAPHLPGLGRLHLAEGTAAMPAVVPVWSNPQKSVPMSVERAHAP